MPWAWTMGFDAFLCKYELFWALEEIFPKSMIMLMWYGSPMKWSHIVWKICPQQCVKVQLLQCNLVGLNKTQYLNLKTNSTPFHHLITDITQIIWVCNFQPNLCIVIYICEWLDACRLKISKKLSKASSLSHDFLRKKGCNNFLFFVFCFLRRKDATYWFDANFRLKKLFIVWDKIYCNII